MFNVRLVYFDKKLFMSLKFCNFLIFDIEWKKYNNKNSPEDVVIKTTKHRGKNGINLFYYQSLKDQNARENYFQKTINLKD